MFAVPNSAWAIEDAHRLRAALAPAGEDPAEGLGRAARMAGFSRRHLSRRARACLGESPAAHARRRRLDAAALALLSADETILSVALVHGFRSHETFTRAFRREFDVTPAAFRRTRGASLSHAARWAIAFARRASAPGPIS